MFEQMGVDPSQMKMTKQAFVTFFLITNFYMLKLWLTLMKKFGGGILKIKIKKERTVFVDVVAVCGSSNCVIKCG